MDQGEQKQQKSNKKNIHQPSADTQEQRLAKALKQNLRRRKQPQASSTSSESSGEAEQWK